MSKLFGNLSTQGTEKVVDRVGGGGTIGTDIYVGKIKAVYAGKSTGGANSITTLIEAGGIELRETHWVTSKTGENTYPDKNDSTKKHLLPGFVTINDLCLLVLDGELMDQSFEEKVLNIYDFEAKREVPTTVPVLTALTGKEVIIAVVEQTVDKQKKDGNGVYQNTGETRTENIIEKILFSDRRTVSEITANIEEPIWAPKWLEKNAGKTRNRAKGGEGKAGAPGRGPGAANAGGNTNGAPAAKKSLFAKN